MKIKTAFSRFCRSISIYKTVLIVLLILLTSCFSDKDQKLNIATAANMQYAMHELSRSFTQETGIICETIVSSSGKLTAQIMEGAPFDIFVSADMRFPNELFKHGFTSGEPKIYAYGKLVIWSINKNMNPDFVSFTNIKVKHIAIANPKTAPYGIVAFEVLNKKGIYDSIKNKLVFGESIAQTNQFITTYAAQIGITSKSSVLSPIMKNKGIWKEIEPDLYNPISQGIVIIKDRNDQIELAERFSDYLFSVKAREILEKHGYSVNK